MELSWYFFFSDLSGDNPHCHPTLDGIHLAIYSYLSTESEWPLCVPIYLSTYLSIRLISHNQSLYLRSTVVSPFFHPIWWRWRNLGIAFRRPRNLTWPKSGCQILRTCMYDYVCMYLYYIIYPHILYYHIFTHTYSINKQTDNIYRIKGLWCVRRFFPCQRYPIDSPRFSPLAWPSDSQELQRFHSRFLYLRLASLFSKIDGFPASFQLGHHSSVAFAKPNPTKTPPQPNTFRHISFTFFNINRRKHTMTSHTQKSRTTPSRQNNTPLRIQRFFPANIQWNVPPQSNNKINAPTKHQQTMKKHEKNNHRHFGSVTIIHHHTMDPHGLNINKYAMDFLPISEGWVPSAASASAWSAAPWTRVPSWPWRRRVLGGPVPKKLQKSRKTMGKLWDKCIKMLVSPGKMLVSPIFLCSMVSFSGFEVWKWGLLGFLSSKGGIFAMKDGDLIRTW